MIVCVWLCSARWSMGIYVCLIWSWAFTSVIRYLRGSLLFYPVNQAVLHFAEALGGLLNNFPFVPVMLFDWCSRWRFSNFAIPACWSKLFPCFVGMVWFRSVLEYTPALLSFFGLALRPNLCGVLKSPIFVAVLVVAAAAATAAKVLFGSAFSWIRSLTNLDSWKSVSECSVPMDFRFAKFQIYLFNLIKSLEDMESKRSWIPYESDFPKIPDPVRCPKVWF